MSLNFYTPLHWYLYFVGSATQLHNWNPFFLYCLILFCLWKEIFLIIYTFNSIDDIPLCLWSLKSRICVYLILKDNTIYFKKTLQVAISSWHLFSICFFNYVNRTILKYGSQGNQHVIDLLCWLIVIQFCTLTVLWLQNSHRQRLLLLLPVNHI